MVSDSSVSDSSAHPPSASLREEKGHLLDEGDVGHRLDEGELGNFVDKGDLAGS